MDFRDKKVILVIVIIAIIIIGIGIYAIMSDSSTRVENFQGIQVTVPSSSNFIVTNPDDGYDTYEDSTYGIEIIPLINNLSLYDEVTFFNESEDKIAINISGLPNGSSAFKTPQGFVEVIIVNDVGSEGIVIGAPGVDFIKNMAESVVFSNGDKAIDNKLRGDVVEFILTNCNCTTNMAIHNKV